MKQLLTLLSGMAVSLSVSAISPGMPTTAGNQPLTMSRLKSMPRQSLSQVELQSKSVENRLKSRFTTPVTIPSLSAPKSGAAPGSLYGYLGQNYVSETYGLKLIDSDGMYTTVWDDPIVGDISEQMMVCGWLYDSKVCGFSPVTINGGLIAAIDYIAYDLESGEVLEYTRLPGSAGKLLMTAAYNESDGYVYGYGATDKGMAFMRAAVTDPTNLMVVKDIQDDSETCQSFTYNPVDKSLYGVTIGGNFVKVDRYGAQTQLFSLKSVNAVDCMTGLAYSVADDTYYWNAIDATYSSAFYSISTVRKTATLICEYNGAEQFMYYIAANEAYFADAPGRATFRSSTFAKGSLSGEVSFTLPTTLNDGTAIDKNTRLSWTISLDGAGSDKGTALSGSIVKAKFENLTEGIHTFAIQSAIGEKTSITVPVSLYIGFDTPAAPENVTLTTEGEVSWNAVTTGANGGYIDPAEVEYEIVIGGVGSTKTKDTHCTIALPVNAPLASYTATVQARTGQKISELGLSNSIIAGRPLSLNVWLEPTYDQGDLFTMVDNNADGEGWSFHPFDSDGSCFWSGFSRTQRMDDWLFLPPIEFDDQSAFYSFDMLAKYLDFNYPDEFVEVKFGTSPDPASMTGLIMSATRIVEPDYAKFGGKFRIETPGTYYIGIHCMSMADMYGVMVREFNVSKSAVSEESPAAVANLEVATVDGVPTVSFTMPTSTMGGKELDKTTEITATIVAASTKTVTGLPGSKHSVAVDVNDGVTRISVTTSAGELQGDVAWTTFRTGESVPTPVDNLTATVRSDMLSVKLNWLAPIQDIANNTIDPENVVYNIYYRDMADQNWRLIQSSLKETSFEYRVEAGSLQMLMELAVQAENLAGANNRMASVSCVLGEPIAIPLYEDFDNLGHIQQGYVMESNNGMSTEWTFLSHDAIADCPTTKGYMLACSGNYSGQEALMWLPAFSTQGASSASLTTVVWTGGANTSLMYQAHGMAVAKELIYVERNGGWRTVAVDLPEDAQNKGWVRIAVSCDFDGDGSLFALDRYSLSPVSSLGEVAGSTDVPAVTAENGVITVTNCNGCTIVVATPDGRTMSMTRAQDDVERIGGLAPGIYLVKAGETTVKVAL